MFNDAVAASDRMAPAALRTADATTSSCIVIYRKISVQCAATYTGILRRISRVQPFKYAVIKAKNVLKTTK